MLADWRMNQGSDQDLTRHDAAPGGGTAAVSPVLEVGGGMVAAGNAGASAAAPGSSGRSSEAATLQFDERGAGRRLLPSFDANV